MAAKFSDLQQICNAWSNAIAYEHETRCHWAELYGNQDFLRKNFPEKRLSVEMDRIHYFNETQLPQHPDKLIEKFINNTSIEQSQVFKKETSVTETSSWQMKEGLKIGMKTKSKADLPLVGSAELELSAEISVERTDAGGTSKTTKYSVDMPIKVPPHSMVEATSEIEKLEISADFTINVILGGYIACNFEKPIEIDNLGKHYFYFFPIASVFKNSGHEGFIVRGGKVLFKCSGRFEGIVGLMGNANYTETPLDKNGQPVASIQRSPKLLSLTGSASAAVSVSELIP